MIIIIIFIIVIVVVIFAYGTNNHFMVKHRAETKMETPGLGLTACHYYS